MVDHDTIQGDVRQLREDTAMLRQIISAQTDVIAILRDQLKRKEEHIEKLIADFDREIMAEEIRAEARRMGAII